ncbi:MAG: prepilin-type N-terminal cleavage/methylation domain-containing protein [Burkholderiaceae bacterium]|nr:prepilin-type N-terminal cleavage/methylation domain-containing protein [Burkholderiaceae bacterium]
MTRGPLVPRGHGSSWPGRGPPRIGRGSSRPNRGSIARSRGFTLLELLVAVALLSVLAVLSWRGMDSVLRSRDRIVQSSDELRALSVAFAQLEQDVRGSWAIGLLGLDEPAIAFTVRGDDVQPELALVRETSANRPLQLQRVRYRLHEHRLERGFAPWTSSMVDPARPVSEQPLVWQPLLAGIDQIQFRAWIASRGWTPAATLARDAGRSRVDGVELTIVRGGERIVRVLAARN